MVNIIKKCLNENTNFKTLTCVSDGICDNNGGLYPDFDKFMSNLFIAKIFNGDTLSSCDTIVINENKNHIIFVEFKDINSLNSEEDVKKWWKGKNKSIYLKITDSILALSYFLVAKYNQNYDNFMNLAKSFFYVYKSNNYKSKINNHLKCKFDRYDFLFENVRTIETKAFEKFLSNNNL